MSKGSREQRTIEFFEQCSNLVVARAILRACTETLEKREQAAGTRKPQAARGKRKARTNSAPETTGVQSKEEHIPF